MNDLSWVDSAGTLHEKCKLIFFLGELNLGECSFDPGEALALRYRRHGICYFCPTCASIWGRIVLIDSKLKRSPAEVYTVSCKDHPDQWNTPGSFLTKGLRGLMSFIPPAVAKMELELRGEGSQVMEHNVTPLQGDSNG